MPSTSYNQENKKSRVYHNLSFTITNQRNCHLYTKKYNEIKHMV